MRVCCTECPRKVNNDPSPNVFYVHYWFSFDNRYSSFQNNICQILKIKNFCYILHYASGYHNMSILKKRFLWRNDFNIISNENRTLQRFYRLKKWRYLLISIIPSLFSHSIKRYFLKIFQKIERNARNADADLFYNVPCNI